MTLTCPICEKKEEHGSEAGWPRFPFCSDRCRLIDLGRWLREDYRIPEKTESGEPIIAEDAGEE
jgi:endogenous inhibitor of DNA gyrase (YacG/DUF329 family)